MSGYPVVEQDGYCASVSTQRAATGRWTSWVQLERDANYARLKGKDPTARRRVPNDYPSEEKAVQAAYEFAHDLISKQQLEH
jgi:hypothetical protein